MNSIVDSISRDWVSDMTEEMVKIPSVTMDEHEVCLFYEQQLKALGLDVIVREVTPGRPNLYARIKGTGDGPTLMLNGHLDTIPNQNNQPVFRDGDLLYGRGTTDMKGGMAAVLAVGKAILESGVQLKGDLLLTAVVGHEEPEANKDGPKALIEDINSGMIGCDRIIIVEGPDALWVMSMGSMVFTVTMTSPKGGTHTQYIPFDENPIRFMGQAIDRIQQFQQELDNGDVHHLAGPERIDLGIAHAGDYFNRLAPTCRLTGTRRWAPGKNAEGVLAELAELMRPFAEAGGLEMDVSMTHEREPFETELDDPIVVAVGNAHRNVVGGEAEAVGKRIVGDANLYVHGSGVKTIYYGPSNETAHADVETVSMSRLESAAKVYALAALEYCGVS